MYAPQIMNPLPLEQIILILHIEHTLFCVAPVPFPQVLPSGDKLISNLN